MVTRAATTPNDDASCHLERLRHDVSIKPWKHWRWLGLGGCPTRSAPSHASRESVVAPVSEPAAAVQALLPSHPFPHAEHRRSAAKRDSMTLAREAGPPTRYSRFVSCNASLGDTVLALFTTQSSCVP